MLQLENKSIRVTSSMQTPGPNGGSDDDYDSPRKLAVGHYDRPWRRAMSKNPLNYDMDTGSMSKSPLVKGTG